MPASVRSLPCTIRQFETADIIGTYVYRIGLGKMDFSIGTAVGLFNSIIGLILVLSSNAAAKKMTGKSIW